MPPVMFSVVTKYHKGRHSLFLYNSEIFYAFTQDILRSHRLNKTLYDELKNQYPELPLKLSDTDDKNERMKAQQGLLSSIDSAKVNDEAKIQSSQIKILADWLQSSNHDDVLKQSGNKYSWNNETLLEKITFELPQRDRNYLQKCLKENGSISTILFPDFEGVKKNIEFSEDYNILRDWEIAYKEAPFHSNFISPEDLLKNGKWKSKRYKFKIKYRSSRGRRIFSFSIN